jgi:hypothetical protein
MPFYIHPRVNNSKAFSFKLDDNLASVVSKRDAAFSVTFILPSFTVQEMNGIGSAATVKFLTKAEEFARKNITIK